VKHVYLGDGDGGGHGEPNVCLTTYKMITYYMYVTDRIQKSDIYDI
jgi:hypothetical protein